MYERLSKRWTTGIIVRMIRGLDGRITGVDPVVANSVSRKCIIYLWDTVARGISHVFDLGWSRAVYRVLNEGWFARNGSLSGSHRLEVSPYLCGCKPRDGYVAQRLVGLFFLKKGKHPTKDQLRVSQEMCTSTD